MILQKFQVLDFRFKEVTKAHAIVQNKYPTKSPQIWHFSDPKHFSKCGWGRGWETLHAGINTEGPLWSVMSETHWVHKCPFSSLRLALALYQNQVIDMNSSSKFISPAVETGLGFRCSLLLVFPTVKFLLLIWLLSSVFCWESIMYLSSFLLKYLSVYLSVDIYTYTQLWVYIYT